MKAISTISTSLTQESFSDLSPEEARLIRAYRGMDCSQKSFLYDLAIDTAIEGCVSLRAPKFRLIAGGLQ